MCSLRYLLFIPVCLHLDRIDACFVKVIQQWKGWNWRSEGDLLLNGAYFTPSGAGASASYARASSLGAKSSSMVGSMTSNAGALGCKRGSQC